MARFSSSVANLLCLLCTAQREEIDLTARHLLGRALTVDVCVNTPRSPEQEAALKRVNVCIDSLLVRTRDDPENAKVTCESYLSACVSEGRGPMDARFQAAVIECTADDQKSTRKRLEAILTALVHIQPSC